MSERKAESAQPSAGQWARDIATTYRQIAAAETWPLRRDANEREALKYELIAARMDLATPPGASS